MNTLLLDKSNVNSNSYQILRAYIEALLDDVFDLGCKELIRRFGCVRTKAQVHIFRSHGLLYRFGPNVSMPSSLVELRHEIADSLNGFLIWLYNNSRENRHVMPAV